MSATLHQRLRLQLEECFEHSASLPNGFQDFIAMVDESYRDAEADPDRTGHDGPGVPSLGVDTLADESIAVATCSKPAVRVEALPDILFVIDDDGTILDCRGGESGDLTFPREHLIGKRMTRCPFGDIGPQFGAAMEAARTADQPLSIEYSLPCRNGVAHFEARLVRSDGARFLAVVRNTTKRAEAARATQRNAVEYRGLLHSAEVAMMLIDPATGTIIECNRRTGSLYGLPPADLVDVPARDLFADAENSPDLKAIAESTTPARVEAQHQLHNGRVIRVEALLSRVKFGGRYAILSVNREIEPTHAETTEASNSLSMLKATLDATADGILVVDPKGNFITCNSLFAEMWKVPSRLLQPGGEQEIAAIILEHFEQPSLLVEELVAIHSSTEVRYSKIVELRDSRFFECVSMPQLIAGQKAGRVWSFRDVTDRMQTEVRIRHHAYHDSLTGLPNRTLFQDRMAQLLGQSRRAGCSSALLMIDLDRFKTINDTLGHAAGDKLLTEVADRLKSRKREGDTIARLGGDEFFFLLSQLRTKEDASIVAEQILEVLKPPIQIDKHELHITASIGIAIFPDDGDDGVSLMKSADVALYRAKDLGRNNYQIYEPKLSQRAMERLVMEQDLRQAIDNREFILQYQPQYDLNTGQMRGVEALIRWMQGDTVVPPSKFIPIAEECGLIVPLGRWVLEESARQCVEFNRHSSEPLRVCVNVSALQIQRPNFASEVSEIMKDAGLPLKQLVLELTESALMQNPEQGSWAMAQLEQMGIGIAMDDFGTGHSSLSHVSHLPISMIKIDQSFVKNCATRKTDATILEAIITMGHAMGLKVLAEGVETEEQADVLRNQGCDEVQGYLFSRPLPAEKVIRLMQADHDRSRTTQSNETD